MLVDETLRPNCSTYNPCGIRGHCENNYQSEWTCRCILWWNGTTCSELTNSGQQVVILGSITFCLIVLYYGLCLRYWLKRRQLNPPAISHGIPSHRSYTRMTSKPLSFRSFVPWLVALGTLLLGSIGITIKYTILKDIHDEIVGKYNRSEPIFYTRPQICKTMYPQPDLNIFTFPIGCFLILLFVFRTKRQSTTNQSFCSGYIGIPIPLDFFAHVKRTFAAVVFAIVADDLTNIALQLLNGTASTSLGEGIILTYLSQILKVLFIGLRCYPILAAIYLDSRLSLISATLYTWLDFGITIAFRGVCRNAYYPSDENFKTTDSEGIESYLRYYGTGSYLISLQLLTDFPRYLFISYVCIRLPILLYKRIQDYKLIPKRVTREQNYLLYSSKANSFESIYVSKLFGLGENELSVHPIKRLLRCIYTWRDDFRYSSRIVCVYVSIIFLLFFLNTQACVQIPPYIGGFDSSSEPIHLKLNLRNSELSFELPNLVRPFFISIAISLIIILIQLIVLLTTIRRNLLQVFRGDHTEIPRRNIENYVSYTNANVHFAGYLIGYVLWGYILIAFFVFLIVFLITFVITFGWIGFVETISKWIIPPIFFGLFQNYLNKTLGQFVFLQQGGKVFSIKNRRILMLVLYFNLYLDAFLGLISSITRILKSAAAAMIYMCRLDYSVFGRKLESYDSGFNAYCGFIQMESAHRHPVVLYFSSLLIREQLYGTNDTRRSKAIQRWHLTVFLLRNPMLIYRRKNLREQNQDVDVRLSLIGRRSMKPLSVEE